MRVEKHTLDNLRWLVLVPFVLVYVADILFFFIPSVTQPLKAFSAITMLTVIIYRYNKVSFNQLQKIAALLFLVVLCYHLVITTHNYMAFIHGAVRYLFPLLVLLYGAVVSSIAGRILIHGIVLFALVNLIAQLGNYVAFMYVDELWFFRQTPFKPEPTFNQAMGIMRGVGVVGYFGLFAFIQFIAFLVVDQQPKAKYPKFLKYFFVLGMLFGLSYRLLGCFLGYLLSNFRRLKHLILIVSVASTLFFIIQPSKFSKLRFDLKQRISNYVLTGNSMRGEAFRVMKESMAEFPFLGQGIGVFGGPEAKKYSSELYDKYDFNFFGETGNTVDTYYPHLFVETGVLGGAIYFLLILIPFLDLKVFKNPNFKLIVLIYIVLFIESIFSFALNNLSFLLASLALIYPLLNSTSKSVVNS